MTRITQPTINMDEVAQAIQTRRAFTPNDFLIDRFIPKRGRYASLGLQGGGKSTIFQHMSIHIALGIDWLGFRTNKARVLWLTSTTSHVVH